MNAITRLPISRASARITELLAPPPQPTIMTAGLETPAGMALLRRLAPSAVPYLPRDHRGAAVGVLVIAHGMVGDADTLHWAMIARQRGGGREAMRLCGEPALWTGRQLLGDARHRWRGVLAADLALEGVTWTA